jgi:hypothetical protein
VNLRKTSGGVTLAGMNTLAEVEAAILRLSAEELAELERLVRNARVRKINGGGRSALDLPPLDLGRMLKPLGCRGDWYEEMLEGRA